MGPEVLALEVLALEVLVRGQKGTRKNRCHRMLGMALHQGTIAEASW